MESQSPVISRKRPSGRTVTACLECQRRKKKCNRQWPCSHCQDRRIAHLCRFSGGLGTQKPRNTAESQIATITATATEQLPAGSTLTSSQENVPSPVGAASAVRALGYVRSGMFQVITAFDASVDRSGAVLKLPEHVLQASRAVPPRPYTDMLVENFFDNVNYHYGILHQPSFMDAYADWWSLRREPQNRRTIALTCLVLRICANSTQFLPHNAVSQLEAELGDSIDHLSANYQSAAETLSDFLPPGAGGLVNAQQLFLGSTWLKAEANFVMSWHALGTAVREAQELGIHVDATTDEMSDIEREMRRRLWCALFTWDKFMTAAFNRPPMIQAGTSIPLPNPSLDRSVVNSDAPSLIVAKVLENQLARQLSDASMETTLADKLSFIETWMSSLPSIFAVNDPDIRWDIECPGLPFQRLQLHCVGYMTQLVLLRPLITTFPGSPSAPISEGRMQETQWSILIAHAIDVSLKAMSVSEQFFHLCFPHQAKYFMVSFCSFDNAALLCSLLLHDSHGTRVPRRLEVLRAIGKALHISRRLRDFTKMGKVTWDILTALTSHLRLTPDEKRVMEDAEKGGEIGVSTLEGSAPSGDKLDIGFDSEWSLPGASSRAAESMLEIHLGVLDGVWDWQGLHLDSFGFHTT
ncbi:fungal-specific transcription factor domain-containing protein [Achaetomium macrosporum]|uniref:Fungal-specific transcription factor domain-containing protein n=1 Tax=Achaetomium macrosporum TaxID=79813 RepID=A0AAN7C0W1_9PEZI|nr:fungal-specific transcription factor domain-containing protein [Achaetomium macrosporum]